MRLQGPWAPRGGTCGHAIRTGSWSKRGCGSRPTGAERWRSLPDREQHRIAQPERICLARGNTALVSPTIGVQRFRHNGRDEMARPMPLEDRVVELDLQNGSASCRERGCQSVKIQVAAVSLKKKTSKI